LVLAGGVSVYRPNDGHNAGQLACGGTFTAEQHHIAIRQWKGRCGKRALVCSAETLRCVWTKVRDSGPWGAKMGKRWEVQIRLKPGWKRRGVVDLTLPVWRELGKPRFLSKVVIWVPE